MLSFKNVLRLRMEGSWVAHRQIKRLQTLYSYYSVRNLNKTAEKIKLVFIFNS